MKRESGVKALHNPSWVKKQIGSFATLVHREFANVPDNYDYSAKNNVRDHMVKETKASLGNTPRIRMLFMPSVQAIDLYTFAKAFDVDSENSLAVEHNEFYASLIQSWIDASDKIIGGTPLEGLPLYVGKMSDATAEIEGKFEVANLDFVSPWNAEIQRSIRNILSRGLLTIPGVMFITVNATEWLRAIHGGRGKKSLPQLIPNRVYSLSNNTAYTCHYRWHMDWAAAEGHHRMLTIAFTVHEKEKRLVSS